VDDETFNIELEEINNPPSEWDGKILHIPSQPPSDNRVFLVWNEPNDKIKPY